MSPSDALDRARASLRSEFRLFTAEGLRLAFGRSTGVFFRLSDEEDAVFRGFLYRPEDGTISSREAVVVRAVLERLRAQSIVREELTPVRSALVLVAAGCNLGCSYCYGRHGEESSSRRMKPELARTVADVLARMGVQTVAFFGGEPLLAVQTITAFVDHSRSRGYDFAYSVTSNGTLLSPEVVEYLRRNRICVSVSIDGGRDTHDITRPYRNGTSSFDDVVRGIRRAADAGILEVLEATYSRRHEKSVTDMLVELNRLWPTITCTAVDGSPGCDHEVDVVRGQGLTQWYEGMLDARKAGLRVGGIDELASQLSERTSVWRPYICSGVMRRMVISQDGAIYPCPELMSDSYRIGSALDPGIVATFESERRRVLALLERSKIHSCWFRDFIDTCIVRLQPDETGWVVAEEDAIGSALEFALGRIVADSEDPAAWSLGSEASRP